MRSIGFLTKVKNTYWLANKVLVHKSSKKWRISVNSIDFNVSCPKNEYPLLNIDCLIDGSSSYRTLSFMDTYSGYNKIKMDLDMPKKTFMFDQDN